MFDFFFKKRELLPLPYERELHCHIIPGVDDGAVDMESSVKYLQALQGFGVKKIVFTPHSIETRFENDDNIVAPIYEKLCEKALRSGIDMEFAFSYEYRIDERFANMLEAGEYDSSECKLRPLHGRYILVENSFNHPPYGLDEILFKLQSGGFYPILAHPERYGYYALRNGDRYHHLQDMQLEFQCNVLSFSGHYGDMAKKAALWLLEQGYVNFLGTDLHNHHHIEALDKFLRSKSYAEIRPLLVKCLHNDAMEL